MVKLSEFYFPKLFPESIAKQLQQSKADYVMEIHGIQNIFQIKHNWLR